MTFRVVLLAISMLGAHRVPGHAGDVPGSTVAHEALAACHAGTRGSIEEQHARLEHGLELAEQALAADEADAAAHFAVFCNLGRQIKLDGLHIWQLSVVRRLHHEIDRALEIAPDATAVLVAKAAFLLELPRLFGGDRTTAERVARMAVESDPRSGTARVVLARALARRGATLEAREELAHVLGADEQGSGVRDADDARLLLATLGEP